MQAVSDVYLRQLRDWKGAAEIGVMAPKGMRAHGRLVRVDPRPCARPSVISASYADQNERDHQALLAAIVAGRISAESGL